MFESKTPVQQQSVQQSSQQQSADTTKLKPYTDVRGDNLFNLDLKNQSDILFTLTFDTETIWPSKDKMPKNFDPEKLLEQGKEPGLGINKLHQQGYTGEGVAVAYIDQHLLFNHNGYPNVNLHNYEIQNTKVSRPSMHGPSVLSLLAGEKIGIVPNADVYYFSHDGAKDNNEYEARAFEKIIEMNKTLLKNKKIKIIGMSHSIEEKINLEYAKHLRKAEEAARKSGIIVVDTSCGMATCGVKGFQDRDDYKNYEISNWEKCMEKQVLANRLIVPADNRTTAVGHEKSPYHYAYWGEGGFSWGKSFIKDYEGIKNINIIDFLLER